MLGTCMWGWNILKSTCFDLLDEFYKKGFREVDTASNYPISGVSNQFHLSDAIISEWTNAHGIKDLKINAKIGSIDNSGSPDNNLSFSYIEMLTDYYTCSFEANLDALMIHWDNREHCQDTHGTMEALQRIESLGFKIGLSGIKVPNVYQMLAKHTSAISIQVKRNLIHNGIGHYKPTFPQALFYAYGTNVSGLNDIGEYNKSSTFNLRNMESKVKHDQLAKIHRIFSMSREVEECPFENIFDLNLFYALSSKSLHGLVIGPSSTDQLKNTLQSYSKITRESMQDWQEEISLIICNNLN